MRLIAGFTMLLWIVGHATGASAHASLVSTEPSDGSVLAAAPKTVELRFNEPVTPAVITVIDAAGKTRGDVTVAAMDKIVTLVEHDADACPISDDLPALVRTLAAVTTMTLTHDSTFVGRGEDPLRAVDIVERLWLNALWGGSDLRDG